MAVELGLETRRRPYPAMGASSSTAGGSREEAGAQGIVIELAGRADDEDAGGTAVARTYP